MATLVAPPNHAGHARSCGAGSFPREVLGAVQRELGVTAAPALLAAVQASQQVGCIRGAYASLVASGSAKLVELVVRKGDPVSLELKRS